MSARWSLCNTCCKNTRDDATKSHMYCGCEARCRRHSKMIDKDCHSGTDVDKQTLISEADEGGGDWEFDKRKREEWNIENPSVPFHTEFLDILEANRDVVIQGTVLENALSFTVNFSKGTAEDADIGFHLNPRFDQQYVPRNSRLKNSWGVEEAQTYHKYPFSRGKPFYIEIFLTHNEFMVAINGVHFCAFSYRYPLLHLDTLEIFGGVRLHKVQFRLANKYPSELPVSCDIERIHNFSIPAFLPERYLLDVEKNYQPYVISLKKNLSVGNEIEIFGRVKFLPHSFYINLQQGTLIWPHPTISMHFNARFRETMTSRTTILCNSWLNNDWSKEVYASEDCYFLPGHDFKIQILCTTDAFHVFHNNQPIIHFEHQTDFTKVDTLYIIGDINIYNITFQ